MNKSTAIGSIYPDTNSQDYATVARWVTQMRGGDVINGLAIGRAPGGLFYVEGHRKPLAWNRAVECLIAEAREKVRAALAKAEGK